MTEPVKQLTVEDLFEQHGERLDLEWVAGVHGGGMIIRPERGLHSAIIPTENNPGGRAGSKASRKRSPDADNKSLVGYLNLIHPHQIQVLGKVELSYFTGLRDISRQDALQQLFNDKPACIIVTENTTVPTALKRKCNEKNIPLFSSNLSSVVLTESLHYYLTNLFADRLTLHGVFMEVMAIGVLISGPSGIGKSELAMELITRGHRLVADDAPQFSRIAPDIINGTCPESLQDFLEVRGLGVINVRELFGDSAIKSNKYLRLITRLEPMANEQLLKLDRLEGSYRMRNILGLDVPEITLPVAPGRNLAVLLECAARNHILRTSGYNAADDFTERQQEFIEQNSNK
jgi:HPr kinase/phosphorylase